MRPDLKAILQHISWTSHVRKKSNLGDFSGPSVHKALKARSSIFIFSKKAVNQSDVVICFMLVVDHHCSAVSGDDHLLLMLDHLAS